VTDGSEASCEARNCIAISERKSLCVSAKIRDKSYSIQDKSPHPFHPFTYPEFFVSIFIASLHTDNGRLDVHRRASTKNTARGEERRATASTLDTKEPRGTSTEDVIDFQIAGSGQNPKILWNTP